jgi:2'-5' RNA ligase
MALADALVPMAIPGRTAPPENWHITLRFLDTVDQVTYERFLAGLDVGGHEPFRIQLDGIGAFPNARRATVVWVGIEKGVAELAALNGIAEEAARLAGLDQEERPFHAHLTLARVRPPADIRSLEGLVVDLGWRCDRMTVYRSRPGRGGARYEPLETVRLGG